MDGAKPSRATHNTTQFSRGKFTEGVYVCPTLNTELRNGLAGGGATQAVYRMGGGRLSPGQPICDRMTVVQGEGGTAEEQRAPQARLPTGSCPPLPPASPTVYSIFTSFLANIPVHVYYGHTLTHLSSGTFLSLANCSARRHLLIHER